MHHKLKLWPCYFESALSGDKRFEIRDNSDRGFQKGDTVELLEYDNQKHTIEQFKFTGRVIKGVITYVTCFSQKPGFVVFGWQPEQLNSDSGS